MKPWAHFENCIVIAGMVALVVSGHPWWAGALLLFVNVPKVSK